MSTSKITGEVLSLRKEQAKEQIPEICDSIDAPNSVEDVAMAIHNRAAKGGLFSGRKSELIIGACVYAACKIDQYPITMDDLVDATPRAEKRRDIDRNHRYLSTELGLETPPVDPIELFEKEIQKFEMGDDAENLARELYVFGIESGLNNGCHPSSLIGASVRIAVNTSEDTEKLFLKDILEELNITHKALRPRERDLHRGIQSSEQFESVDTSYANYSEIC